MSSLRFSCFNGVPSPIWSIQIFQSLSAGLTGGECLCLSQGRCHSWTCTHHHHLPSRTHKHMKENEDRHLYKHSFTHKLNLFLLYSFLISHSLPLYFSHSNTHINTHTLTKLTCQFQSDQEQKNSCQFEADIINGFGRGRALKTKGVQGRADLKCTFILAGTLAFWFQPLYSNIFFWVALTFIITPNRGPCETLLCWWREMWHP